MSDEKNPMDKWRKAIKKKEGDSGADESNGGEPKRYLVHTQVLLTVNISALFYVILAPYLGLSITEIFLIAIYMNVAGCTLLLTDVLRIGGYRLGWTIDEEGKWSSK